MVLQRRFPFCVSITTRVVAPVPAFPSKMRASSLDECQPKLNGLARDQQLVVARQRDAFALSPVAEGGVVKLDQAGSGCVPGINGKLLAALKVLDIAVM